MREYLAYLFVIGLSAAFLWHFSLIATQGTVIIKEPSLAVLSLEIAMVVSFIAFAMVNMIRMFRRG